MRILVLSGGGAKGAYEAGAIRYLMGAEGISYDAYCGTSAGALNSAFLAMYPQGEEDAASSELVALWKTIDTKKVYKRWCPFGKLHGLWKTSFYNSAPLHKLVREGLDMDKVRKSGKQVCVIATDLQTGNVAYFREWHTDLPEGVLASSAVPGLFIPIEIGGRLYVDGVLRENVPLAEAIRLGGDSPALIDVVVTTPEQEPSTSQFENAIDILGRSVGLLANEVIEGDLLAAENLSGVRIIRPMLPLSEDPLDFDPSNIARMLESGYNDARIKVLSERSKEDSGV